MARKKRRAKRLSFASVLKISMVCLMVLFVISIVSTQVQLASAKNELDDLNAEIQSVQEDSEEKRQMLESDDAEFMERIARDEYGYVMPGEQVFSDVSGS